MECSYQWIFSIINAGRKITAVVVVHFGVMAFVLCDCKSVVNGKVESHTTDGAVGEAVDSRRGVSQRDVGASKKRAVM